MSAQRYFNRLHTARIVWTVIAVCAWVLYMLYRVPDDGAVTAVTVFISGLWLLGFPRNMAKRLARGGARIQDLNDAIEKEIGK